MAFARKLPSGKFQGVAKQGRTVIGTKAWPTRREALAWAERTESAAAGGLDLRAGKAPLRQLVPLWVEHRRATVSPKTARTDAELLRLLSPAMLSRAVASIQPRDCEAWFLYLRRQHDQSDSSIKRYRLSLSAFFAWCVADHRLPSNAVAASKLPRPVGEPSEMLPFTEAELNEFTAAVRERSPWAADLILFAAWTGLRWGELRAVRVSDLQEVPTPALRVQRSQTEGQPVKGPKSGKPRRVPLADAVLPIVHSFAAGKAPGELLFTGPEGGQLWASAFKRASSWPALARGRRLHDLRHTAACLWLSKGVDPGTVQAWLGHSSIATTNLYLHHLGSSADAAGLARLNASADPGGAPGVLVTPPTLLLEKGDAK